MNAVCNTFKVCLFSILAKRKVHFPFQMASCGEEGMAKVVSFMKLALEQVSIRLTIPLNFLMQLFNMTY